MVTKENRTALLGLWINRIKHKLKNTETPPLQSYPVTLKISLFQKYLTKKKKKNAHIPLFKGFLHDSVVKNLPEMQETCRKLGFDHWIGKIS